MGPRLAPSQRSLCCPSPFVFQTRATASAACALPASTSSASHPTILQILPCLESASFLEMPRTHYSLRLRPQITNGSSPELSQTKAEFPADSSTTRAVSKELSREPAEPSPARMSSSASISSVDPDMLGEIVVGTHHNGDRHSPHRGSADPEDEHMADAGRGPSPGNTPPSHYPKRKRSAVYADLGEDKMETESLKPDDDEAVVKPARHPLPKRQGNTNVKGVIVGYWRDSTVPNDENKHAVIGFMDVRDRLRTRVHMQTVSGASINARLFPIPPGPGGSWVTFERIVFSDHLVGEDHNVVKEYVKLRGNAEPGKKGDLQAVEMARAYLEKNPPPETPQPLQIAWGKEIPEHVQSTRDPQFKRRRTGEGITTIAAGTSPAPATPQHAAQHLPPQSQPLTSASTPREPQMMQFQQQHQPPPPPQQHAVQHGQQLTQLPTPPQRFSHAPGLESLPGTRPTRILVGCWAKSDAPLDKDKHAVYGILGANDMFRVKLVRETMDGRFVEGNFPQGAGALWIAYEEVTFLPHLQGLTRPETKEYVRVRQAQLDAGETDAERVANETKAVYEAQARVAANPAKTGSSQLIVPRHATDADQHMLDAGELPPPPPPKIDGRSSEARQARREAQLAQQLAQQQAQQQQQQQQAQQHARYSLPEAEIREMGRGNQEHFERQRNIVDRAMTRMENNQERDDRYAASRAAMSTPPLPNPEARRDFQDNIQRMQKVWIAQENGRMRPVQEDEAKTHAGVKYERRANGPFAGKLVSQGTIISIDGEDYVEYRVLTKPTFF
ncbi:uncharacterized protein B0I36DRAFT_4227 [Microdochium trichocladiopsis]|uniref:Uncharacterized protein n=1 Tax=Microdochium trichocladiopsis TaxID=1682393 RepID=A0A9P9BZD5_9PEZI|nr:uncharacterized protein B0I36DRAFT_4227 [Microdochium trichocladiopsis]KAH7039989.1 hypothetical protein B0I36DRAFT_4227 [Microdochium trichocladiopsis]